MISQSRHSWRMVLNTLGQRDPSRPTMVNGTPRRGSDLRYVTKRPMRCLPAKLPSSRLATNERLSRLRRRPRAVEVLLCSLGGLAAVSATGTVWSETSNCANTGVARGMTAADGGIAWAAFYFAALGAVLIAPWLAGRAGASIGALGIGLAGVAFWALAASVLAPFEAFPPQATSAPVSILCDLQPQAGFWAAAGAVVLVAASWVIRWVPAARHETR